MSERKRGCSVSLIGPDGVGKTTLARRTCASLGDRARYVYLGSNPAAATHNLPTTMLWLALKRSLGRPGHRAGPPEPARASGRPGLGKRVRAHLKSLVTLALRVSEDAFRLLVVSMHVRRGRVVLMDRHPFADYYTRRVAADEGWRRIGDRIHGWLLDRAYPRPGLTVLLDAPPWLLHARKPEGSLAAVAARRKEYRRVARVLTGVVRIDASRREGEVFESLLKTLQAETHGLDRFATARPPAEASGRDR